MSIRIATLLFAAGLLSSPAATGADGERGRTLHDAHCRMCHGPEVYTRDARVAKTYDELRAQVVRWQAATSLRWSKEDIDHVTAHLAATYYGIPCPTC